MRGVNKVILVATLGQDPEVRYMPNNDAVTKISVATTEYWNDKNTGQKQESTEWHRVTFFGKLAEIAGEYLKKGSKVYIEGSLHTRKWQDKQTGQDRYSTEIKAASLQMLDSRPDQGHAPQQQQGYAQQQRQQNNYANAQGGQRQQQRQQAPSQFDDFVDDLPF